MSPLTNELGRELPTVRATIERERLRAFADSIGEESAIYRDTDAAKAAGHPDLPVPPTFLFGLKLDPTDPLGWMGELGADTRYILHGTQRFEYHGLVHAGDEVTFAPHIAQVYEKRGGALEFVVVETGVTRDGETVAILTETLVIRHPEKEAA